MRGARSASAQAVADAYELAHRNADRAVDTVGVGRQGSVSAFPGARLVGAALAP